MCVCTHITNIHTLVLIRFTLELLPDFLNSSLTYFGLRAKSCCHDSFIILLSAQIFLLYFICPRAVVLLVVIFLISDSDSDSAVAALFCQAQLSYPSSLKRQLLFFSFCLESLDFHEYAALKFSSNVFLLGTRSHRLASPIVVHHMDVHTVLGEEGLGLHHK